ncbi:hypothetical protein DPX16_12759 [Anabarilius grahami]|uniref:Uncharacterized protein n=1 Tax=Anabarilius grahami TaxID=495550 RepID=A0A3N0XPS4_ANAGA|nr:hypothetical protein DPX16_12759 [Anabarilius grahami]
MPEHERFPFLCVDRPVYVRAATLEDGTKFLLFQHQKMNIWAELHASGSCLITTAAMGHWLCSDGTRTEPPMKQRTVVVAAEFS